jgi:hypothetical protein
MMRGEEEEGWSRVTLLTLSPHSVSWTIDAGLTFAQCRCRPPDGQGIPENCRRVRNHSRWFDHSRPNNSLLQFLQLKANWAEGWPEGRGGSFGTGRKRVMQVAPDSRRPFSVLLLERCWMFGWRSRDAWWSDHKERYS